MLGGPSEAIVLSLESGDKMRLSVSQSMVKYLSADRYTYNRHDHRVFFPSHRQLAAFTDNTLVLWSFGAEDKHDSVGLGHSDAVTLVVLTPDGKQLASASNDRMLKLWDVNSGKETKLFSGHTGPITAMAFSPDGIHLVAASADSTIRLWRTNSGEQVTKLSQYYRLINSVALSPDGTRLSWASSRGGSGSVR